MDLIPVHLACDDAGHCYVVPAELREDFHALLERAWNDDLDAQEEFMRRYGHYRTGGGFNNVQLYAKREDVNRKF